MFDLKRDIGWFTSDSSFDSVIILSGAFQHNEHIVRRRRLAFSLGRSVSDIVRKGQCPECGKWHKGIALEGVNAPVQ